MIKPITNILVPVDFSENTEVAISKALEFCPAAINNCTIHLYHVQRIVLHGYLYLLTKTLAGYTQQQVNDDIKKSQDLLEQLKENIQKERDVNVLCWVSFGETVQE
ncbi:MAG: universal stress protein, partial [Nitrososphaerales archaeon]